jgi:putative Holliday junction resolvase
VTRVLAIDLGEVRMGLAISDELMITAQPLPTWRRKGKQADVAHLKDLVGTWGVERVVVGYEHLENTLAVPVVLWDERYSTVAAERALIEGGVRRQRRQQLRDSVAALLILQGYLDRQGRDT